MSCWRGALICNYFEPHLYLWVWLIKFVQDFEIAFFVKRGNVVKEIVEHLAINMQESIIYHAPESFVLQVHFSTASAASVAKFSRQ